MSPVFDQSDLQNRCMARVDACLLRAEKHFNQTIKRPPVTFDLRGRAAGQLRFSKRRLLDARLRFNSEMLVRYGNAFIEEVVPHEVGHYIAYLRFGSTIKPHGKEWRYIVQNILGAQAAVTHSFEVEPARLLKRFVYACDCTDRQHELSAIRHGRVSRQRAQYYCRVCKGSLNYLREADA